MDEQQVRRLLGEHKAPFPKIMFVSPKDWRLYCHDPDRPALGMFHRPDGERDYCEICLQSRVFSSTRVLLDTIIHELYHWRDSFDTNSRPDRLDLYGLLFLLYVGLTGLTLLCLFVLGLFVGPAVIIIFVAPFLVSAFVRAVDDVRRMIKADGLRHLNVYGRALLGSYDPRWKQAIKISELKDGE